MTRTIVAILGFAIAIAVFFFYTKPTYDEIRSLKALAVEYDQALDKASELQRLKQALLSRYNAFDPSDIDRLHKLLPDHVDNVRLVLDLDNMASRFALALQNVVVSASSGSGVAADTIGGSTLQYDSLTFKFATEGTYANFVQFMEALESSLRVVDLISLSMNNAGTDAGGTTAVEPRYRFDVTVRTYWLK